VFIACGIMHRQCCLLAQCSAPEDGRNYRPKHVELIEIINKIITVASSWLFILDDNLPCSNRESKPLSSVVQPVDQWIQQHSHSGSYGVRCKRIRGAKDV